MAERKSELATVASQLGVPAGEGAGEGTSKAGGALAVGRREGGGVGANGLGWVGSEGKEDKDEDKGKENKDELAVLGLEALSQSPLPQGLSSSRELP